MENKTVATENIKELGKFVDQYKETLTIEDNFERMLAKGRISDNCKEFLQGCPSSQRISFYLVGYGMKANFDFAQGAFKTETIAEEQKIGQIILNLTEPVLNEGERKEAEAIISQLYTHKEVIEK